MTFPVALLVALSACANPFDPAAVRDAGPTLTRATVPAAADRAARRAQGTKLSGPEAATRLASQLRPFEGQFPSREALEATFEAPVEVLLDLATTSADAMVRANALHVLGSFPDSTAGVDLLLRVAQDTREERGNRMGALSGLGQPGMLDEARVATLLPLVERGDEGVRIAAVIALVSWDSARPAIRRVVDAPDTPPDLRRIAGNRLAGAEKRRTDQGD